MSEQQRPRAKVWQPWFDHDDDEELRRRAAQQQLGGGGGVGGSGQPPPPGQDRRSPSKDLPTRQRKLERSESRRNDPLTAPKLRVKRQDSAAYSDAGDDAAADTPLDMSVSRRGSPPPYRAAAAAAGGGQYARRSVITCGPGRSDSEDGAGSDGDLRTDDVRSRGEIIKDFPGVCDPVIDEHFRRSLGKHYASLFKTSAPSPPQANDNDVTGMSVDDHFAKALGETWVKLQEQDQAGDQVSSVLPLVT